MTLNNASDLGVLSGSQTMTVRLGLQLHNVDGLKAAIASHSELSPSQVAASYGPTSSDVAQVQSYLQSQGFTNITVEPNNLLISATASAATVSKAFDTTLHNFSFSGATVYANTAPAYVPQALGGIVVAVLGLNNVKTMGVSHHPKTIAINHAAATASATAPQPESPCAFSSVFIIGLPSPQPIPTPAANYTGCPRNYTPSDYWRAYDVNTTAAASNVPIAILTEGNPSAAVSDFRVNEQGDGLPQVPVIIKNVGLPGTDTSADAEGEWTLDMTASSGMAGNLRQIYLYAATSFTDSDIALMINRFVSDDLAHTANASFGGCEVYPYLDGSMLVDDEALAMGAAQGQTLFASTGDTGSFCSVGNPNGVPGGAPLVEYPATSPYAVGVGGTTLWTQLDGTYQGESAWNAGGGGISQFEYSPSWESPTQPVGTTPVGFTFRGLPDIAMDGDLQTGMIMYMQGSWTVIGGTSLSSPLMAGVWTRMRHAHPATGFAAPDLYAAFSSATPGTKLLGPPPTINTGGFHDVISGANGAYSAAPGYDYTTGMGSVDVDALNAAIGKI
ncbi:MAG TPA: S53 family peptidase [Candidatus Elarobacter sp.]|jgi:subtilase family serine protease|nr:S53 family peptidase [Candidatus Elarobacter sp.]